MGDNIDDVPNPALTNNKSVGWLELACLQEELEDAKKVIMALQSLAAENTTALERSTEEPKWKRNTSKNGKGPRMAKPDTFSGLMDETESFINLCTMYI